MYICISIIVTEVWPRIDKNREFVVICPHLVPLLKVTYMAILSRCLA